MLWIMVTEVSRYRGIMAEAGAKAYGKFISPLYRDTLKVVILLITRLQLKRIDNKQALKTKT